MCAVAAGPAGGGRAQMRGGVRQGSGRGLHAGLLRVPQAGAPQDLDCCTPGSPARRRPPRDTRHCSTSGHICWLLAGLCCTTPPRLLVLFMCGTRGSAQEGATVKCGGKNCTQHVHPLCARQLRRLPHHPRRRRPHRAPHLLPGGSTLSVPICVAAIGGRIVHRTVLPGGSTLSATC